MTRNERFGPLDGLRGVAALIVVMAHYTLAFQPALHMGGSPDRALRVFAQTPLMLLCSPQFGVAVFFVLSGFVLSHVMTHAPASFAELAVRRWARLSGPVVATTLAIWLWLATGYHPDLRLAAENHSPWLAMNFSWRAWQGNDLGTALYQSVIDLYVGQNKHWWNTSLWTLQIELWGSLTLFFAYAMTARWSVGHRGRLAIAVAVTVLNCRNDFGVIAAGSMLYELRCLGLALPRRLAWACGLLLCAGGMLLGGTPVFSPHWTPYRPLLNAAASVDPDPLNVLHRLGAFLMVAATLIWQPLAALLTTRLFTFLGRISFMVYLCHVSLLCACATGLVLRLMPHVGYDAACALALPAFMALLLAVAAFGTRWVDRPCIAFSQRLGRAFAAALSAGSATLEADSVRKR